MKKEIDKIIEKAKKAKKLTKIEFEYLLKWAESEILEYKNFIKELKEQFKK